MGSAIQQIPPIVQFATGNNLNDGKFNVSRKTSLNTPKTKFLKVFSFSTIEIETFPFWKIYKDDKRFLKHHISFVE